MDSWIHRNNNNGNNGQIRSSLIGSKENEKDLIIICIKGHSTAGIIQLTKTRFTFI